MKRRKVTFEYVMLDGINDSDRHAKELIRLLEGTPAKMNLIPFNRFPGTSFRCSPPERIEAFRQRLKKVAGFSYVPQPMPMRNSKGAVVYYLFFASQKPVAADIVNDIFNKYKNRGMK